jgi:PAS domain S-box-containing protein
MSEMSSAFSGSLAIQFSEVALGLPQSEPREADLLFGNLLDDAGDAMLVSDAKGKILCVNARSEDLFGYDRQELIGKPIELLLPLYRKIDTADRFIRAERANPCPTRPDLYGLCKDGRKFPADIRLSAFKTNTSMVFAGAIRDATDCKGMEDQVQSLQRFEQLIFQLSATVVHLPPKEVEGKINNALKVLAEIMDFDRVCMGSLTSTSAKLTVLSAWARPGIPDVTFKVVGDHYPWVVQQVVAGKSVYASSPTDLPLEAGVDRDSMLSSGEQSLLAIPLFIGPEVIGVISFHTFRNQQAWDSLLVSQLQHVAGIFSNVLARKRTDEELQSAYTRIQELRDHLEQENVHLRQEIRLEYNHANIVGQSAVMRDILKQAEQVAATDSVVLILGETGTGKELLARTIHDLSSRQSHAMVKINCAALPATLIESELFGREKGAYTGALTREIGRFELADKSTIFLDEIGDLPMEVQAKLLRVLQEGEFERLGSPKTFHVDVRVIAATNRDLSAAVADGKFREDLFYRLSVFPICIPPLRERREDIQELVWHILQDLGKRMGRNIQGIQAATLKAFQNYSWPGNIRELRNVIERNLILNSGPLFRAKLPEAKPRPSAIAGVRIQEVEREHIVRVLCSTAWRIRGQQGAAGLLGLKPTTLESRMKRLNIQKKICRANLQICRARTADAEGTRCTSAKRSSQPATS